MNILFIGPYRQNDGWGYAAYDYAKALLTTKHDIAIRPIFLAKNISSDHMGDDILTAENKQFDNTPDVVIQHTLPYLFTHTESKHNIGLGIFETGSLHHTSWIRHINLMDMIWTPSTYEQMSIKNSGVTIPIKRINCPIDISRYSKTYDTTHIIQRYGIPSDTFKFYFIGEYTHRKNIIELLLAFYREFGRNDNVDLIIKTNRSGVQPHVLENKVQQDILQLQKSMRLYKNDRYYKRPIIITDTLSDHDMCALHTICDCFATSSYGESICRPALDAMGFNNTPIATDQTGMTEFINNVTGWLVPSIKFPVLTSEPPIPDIYTSWETWSQPDIIKLQASMREAYELSNSRRIEKQESAKEMINKFSYTNIGRYIETILEELV